MVPVSYTHLSRTIGGLYTPGFSVLPSTRNYDYDKLENPYTYDPEKAKQILDDAGIVDTDGDGIRELDGQNINLRSVSYTHLTIESTVCG